VTGDDLDEACDHVLSVLRPEVGRVWADRAGTGIWTARATAEHVGDTLMAYAAQLVVRPDDKYVEFVASAAQAEPVALLDFVRAGAGMLAATVRTSGADVRAFHPSGMADPEGFAGMGCVELLVHGEDVARGFGFALDPARELCERVLARMFPTIRGTEDPWDALLWATGRIELPDRSRRTSWRWHGAPLED
jgi:uncharacterized protein (TIGR03083 family)